MLLVAVLLGVGLAGRPAVAQLLGLEHFLSTPKVEYSADLTVTGDGEAVTGKVNRARGKERREIVTEGDVEVLIVRADRNLVWSLSLEEKLYLEASLDEALGRTKGPDGRPRELELKLTLLGEEKIGGIVVAKQRLVGKDFDGTPIEGMAWVTGQGIVLRLETTVMDEDGKSHHVRMELHNLRIGPQNPALFEIPLGFTQIVRSKVGLGTPDERRLTIASAGR